MEKFEFEYRDVKIRIIFVALLDYQDSTARSGTDYYSIEKSCSSRAVDCVFDGRVQACSFENLKFENPSVNNYIFGIFGLSEFGLKGLMIILSKCPPQVQSNLLTSSEGVKQLMLKNMTFYVETCQ